MIIKRRTDVCDGMYLIAECDAPSKYNPDSSLDMGDGKFKDRLLDDAVQQCMFSSADVGFDLFLRANPDVVFLEIYIDNRRTARYERFAPVEKPAPVIGKALWHSWEASLQKGVRLCENNVHAGDAITLTEILNFLRTYVEK